MEKLVEEIDAIEEHKVETLSPELDGSTKKILASIQPPLYWTSFVHPVQYVTSKIIAKKAMLVIYMIHRRVGGEIFEKLLSDIIVAGSPPALTPSTTSTLLHERDENNSVGGGDGNSDHSKQQSALSDAALSRRHNAAISTRYFMKLIKKSGSGLDVKLFEKHWMYVFCCIVNHSCGVLMHAVH
jgi:hypothetical protein